VTRPAAPSPGEVSALIAWMRRLSDAGISHAGPAELAAFQNAKKNLIARIERRDDHPGDTQ
jgi:hypothetical protein